MTCKCTMRDKTLGNGCEICNPKDYDLDSTDLLCIEKYLILKDRIRELKAQLAEEKNITMETSDGYHTFNELYEHRHILFLHVLLSNLDLSWKAKRHSDGSIFDGWFIAGLETDLGHATYHLPLRMWGLFSKITTLDNAPEYDGHTPEDTLIRIREHALKYKPFIIRDGHGDVIDVQDLYPCTACKEKESDIDVVRSILKETEQQLTEANKAKDEAISLLCLAVSGYSLPPSKIDEIDEWLSKHGGR